VLLWNPPAGDPAILQQAAITQLFMAQAPVPVEILLGEGVLERLLPVSTQLGTIKKLYGRVGVLHAPASCINPVTGKMSFEVCAKQCFIVTGGHVWSHVYECLT
jgi:hypothetical protein